MPLHWFSTRCDWLIIDKNKGNTLWILDNHINTHDENTRIKIYTNLNKKSSFIPCDIKYNLLAVTVLPVF